MRTRLDSIGIPEFLKKQHIKSWNFPINENTPRYPLAAAAITALRRQAESNGSGDFSPLWSGHIL